MRDGAVCRGCWAVGNACGRCQRCRKEARDAVMDAHRLRELVKEFADFCEDSGWKNVAEELRRRAGV